MILEKTQLTKDNIKIVSEYTFDENKPGGETSRLDDSDELADEVEVELKQLSAIKQRSSSIVNPLTTMTFEPTQERNTTEQLETDNLVK